MSFPIPTTPLKVKEFAKHIDVTPGKVYTWIRQGYLIQHEASRMIDPNNPTNALWLIERQGYVSMHAEKPVGNKRGPKEQCESFDAEEMLLQVGDISFDNLTKASVDKLHKMEALLKTRIERQAKRKELIDRSLVRTVFGRLYQIDTNELQPIGAKITPLILSITGVDDPEVALKIEQAIASEVMKTLQHIKRTLNDALNSWGTDAL